MKNPDNMRDDLQEILNQEQYQRYYGGEKNIIQIWWANIKEWFRDLLSKLFIEFQPSNSFADTVLVIIFGVVILLLLFGIFLIIRSSRRKRAFQSHKPIQSMNELEWSVECHLQAAKKQSKQGEFSLATRHQFLALLLHFHEQGWLNAKSWKTNWDYFAELQRKSSSRAKIFNQLALTFDEAFYGKRDVSEPEYESYKMNIQKWLDERNEMHHAEG